MVAGERPGPRSATASTKFPFSTCAPMRTRPVLFAALLAVIAACDKPPPDSEARDWTPADHDHIPDARSKFLYRSWETYLS